MKSFVTIAIMFNLAALAELPPSLDDVLFSMTGGTNYVAWIATEGEIAFRKPFSLFGSARFRSFHPTNDAPSLHYSITMEKRFYGVASPSNIIESLKQAEGVLQKQFEQRFSRREDSSSYQSKCIDIDGLGWDASFCVEPVSEGNAMPTYIAKAVFYNSLHKEGRFVSCEDLFNKCECGQSAPVVVVASTPAFSNVCKAVGASIRVLDLRNVSQKDLIWITEEVDLILATRDFTREELDRLAKAVSVECVNWDYEDVSPKGVEYLTSIIHKHREERRICAEILDRRSKMSDEERIAEYYALIEKEDCGPFEFRDALASDVFTGVLQRINSHLRRRHSEYEFSGSYGVTGVEMVNDASITNRHYTLYIPRMPPLKMWQYVAEQLNCSVTNRNGFIEMEQLGAPAEKANPNIVNVTVPIPAMTNDVAGLSRDKRFVAKAVIAKGVDLAKYMPDQNAVDLVAQSDVYLSLGLPFEDSLCKRALQKNSALKIFNVTNGCYTIDKNIYVWLTPENMTTIAANVRRSLLPENKFLSWSCMSLKDQYKNLGLTVAIAHPALEYPCRYFGLRFVRIYDSAGLIKREEIKRIIRDSNAVIILAVECQMEELPLVVPQGIEVGSIDIFEETALVQFTKLIHRAVVIYTDRELENTGDNNCEHR